MLESSSVSGVEMRAHAGGWLMVPVWFLPSPSSKVDVGFAFLAGLCGKAAGLIFVGSCPFCALWDVTLNWLCCPFTSVISWKTKERGSGNSELAVHIQKVVLFFEFLYQFVFLKTQYTLQWNFILHVTFPLLVKGRCLRHIVQLPVPYQNIFLYP